jgi:streptogramin lyase
LVALVLALPGIADAEPRVAKVVDVNDEPRQITRGPGKPFWVPLANSELARIAANGTVTHFAPGDLSGPVGLTLGRDGNLWATQNGDVVRIPPNDPNSAEAFPIAAIGDPRRIVNGPEGKLWTASGDKLISFDPANPAGFEETTIEDGDDDPLTTPSARGIAASGGRLFVADFGEKRIVRITPGGGQKTFNTGGGPQEVARGSGKRVAFTNQGADPHKIGRIDRNRVKQNQVPDMDPFGITFAAGNWWIANFTSRKLTVLPPKGKPRKRLRLPADAGARWIAKGADGMLGVSLETAHKVALIKGVKR